jgi:hypothetical protein|tara:strand:- start:6201 stop:6458 length:258 start_codon:yes stop_codon:yes gene_type:complete
MEEMEKYKIQQEILEDTMYWSYLLITKQMTFDELLDSDEDFGLIYNPDDEDSNFDEAIDTLLDFFIYREEYEKCQDLVDVRKLYK